MPYIFTYNIFPHDQSENISKVYLKEIKEARAALRPLAKEIIPNAVWATTEGMSVIGVWDVKEGKLEEALALNQKQLLAYHVIPGYKYKMEVRFKVTEALEMLGMKPPE
jgi:predicted phosphatase